jgi:hypothetical protein
MRPITCLSLNFRTKCYGPETASPWKWATCLGPVVGYLKINGRDAAFLGSADPLLSSLSLFL